MQQFKFSIGDRLLFSPKLEEKLERELHGKSNATIPKKKAKQEQISLLSSHWYALKRITEARGTLLVVEGSELNQYLKTKKYKGWELAFEQSFKTKDECADFCEGLAALWALEDPNKVPRRQGGPKETERITWLGKCLEHHQAEKKPRLPWNEKEIDLIHSIFNQWDKYDRVLTPKQWDFIWRFYDQIKERLERRKANREREGKNEQSTNAIDGAWDR